MPRAWPGERKVVTVLFADLTGYTALAASLDPEEVYRFIRPAMTGLVELVESFGGTVPQVMGDGFLAVFGVPIAHEDDAERAVRAGLAAVESIRSLNAGRSGIRVPEVHAGLNTGEVLVAPAVTEPSGWNITGDVVNVGSRVGGLATGGQVLVTERTRSLTAHAIRYGPRSRRTVKGKSEPIDVFEALGTTSDAPAGHVSPGRDTPFVGRQRELGRLDRAVRLATERQRTGVLVVIGDSGMGKSRLASELRSRLRGYRFVVGTCPAYGQRLPLAALAQAVGQLGKLGGGPALARHLRTLVGDGAGVPGSSPADSGPDVRGAAAAVLREVARREPTVLVIDDLQWADDDLLAVLQQAHDAAWPGRLFVLGLARPGIERAISGLSTLRLDAMPAKDLNALASVVLGAGLPAPALRSLVDRSGGNPLFLEESALMLAESGVLVHEVGWVLADPAGLETVPATLRLLIAARLDGLTADEKRVLQDAAVAGTTTWDRLSERLSGPDATATLRRLEARGLLRRLAHSSVPDAVAFEFKHALIHDVAYESVPRTERAARHRQIADWLRETSRSPDEHLDALAHHFELAWELAASRTGSGPDPEAAGLAADHLKRWGDRVFAFQPRLAESVYSRGLTVARSQPGQVGAAVLAELLIGRAESLIELARPDEALADAREALDLAAYFGRSDLRARALLALGRAESDIREVRTARGLLEEALGLLEAEGDVRGQAWALHRLSETWRLDDLPREVALLRRAHDLLASLGDRWGRALMAQEIAYLLTTDGGDEFDESFAEARALSEAEGDLRSRAALARTASYHAHYRWDFARAITAAREAAPAAREAGDTWVELDAMVIEALSSAAIRPPAEAAALAEELARRAKAVQSPRLRALASLAAARAALRGGDPGGADRHLRSARRTLSAQGAAGESGDADVVESLVSLDRGAWRRAGTLAERIGERARQGGWRLFLPIAPLVAGRAALGAGRIEEATTLLQDAAERAREVEAPAALALARAALEQARLLAGGGRAARRPRASATAEVRAILEENRGLAAERRDEALEAADAYASAASCWEELGFTVWLARALLLRARSLRAARRPADANRSEARARTVLAAIAAPEGALG